MANTPSRSPAAGGFLIALGAIGGAATGLFYTGQPTRDFLIGTGLGIVVAVIIWLVDRAR